MTLSKIMGFGTIILADIFVVTFLLSGRYTSVPVVLSFMTLAIFGLGLTVELFAQRVAEHV